jgi:hypothetical protein
LRLADYDIGGDEGGMGHVILDRLQMQNFFLKHINNGSPTKRSEIFANLSAEWWSTTGQLIERKAVILPNDEKLVAQLTSRRKLYDSRGRERLESKADLRARGIESPDRADAIIGAIILAKTAKARGTARELRELRVEINREGTSGTAASLGEPIWTGEALRALRPSRKRSTEANAVSP